MKHESRFVSRLEEKHTSKDYSSLSLSLKITKFYEAIKKITSLDFKMILKVHLDKYSLIHIKYILCILNGDHIDTVSRNKIKIRVFFICLFFL